MEKTNDNPRISVGILTVSDSCYNGTAEDKSGPNLRKIIESGTLIQGHVSISDLVPDDIEQIKDKLIDWCDNKHVDLILTSGGTGVSPRDVTPEATKMIIEKEVPGITLNMLQKSLAVTQTAMLSRPVSGIRGRTLIINFPGSKKASEECLHFVSPCLQHAIDLLNERSPFVEKTHAAVQSLCSTKTEQSVDGRGSHASGCGHYRSTAKPTLVNQIPTVHDPSDISKRPRESLFPMLSMDDALSVVMENALVLSSETCHYHDALGRVLSEDIFCPADFPPFPASIKDGYAVLSSDGAGLRKVMSVSTAGVHPGLETVKSGYCTRISTGAPVPNGADSVVQVEDTELISENAGEEAEIKILQVPSSGQDIRPIGSDLPKGLLVLAKNTRLGPTELSLLASIGVIFIECYKQPRVGLLSTGDEIAEPDLSLKEGKIRDSNKIALRSTLQEQGFKCVDLGIVGDDARSLRERIARLDVDVLVTTGGVSMGEKDLLKYTLQAIGVKIHFGRIFMKPGKPTTFGTKDKCLYFCLPGNPVSAIVTCHVFVVPALRKMSGIINFDSTVVKAQIQNEIRLDPRPEYHRVTLDWSSAVPRAFSTGNQGSCRLLSMKSANALLKLPPISQDKSVVHKGDIFDAVIISPF